MNQCIRLSQSLVTFSNSRPIKEINLSLIGIQAILGDLRSVNTYYLLWNLSWSELKKFMKNLFNEFVICFLLIKKGLSNYLNKRETYLDSDFLVITAPAATYDTDLENFWTQSSINIVLYNSFSFICKLNIILFLKKILLVQMTKLVQLMITLTFKIKSLK